MSVENAVYLLLFTSLILANIPWFSSTKIFIFFTIKQKSFVLSVVEWSGYLLLMGGISYLLELRVMGHVKEQDWEFYGVTILMFAIFAFPGFIYRYNLRKFIKRSSKR